MAVGVKMLKGRKLQEGEKMVTVLIGPKSFEYRFEPEVGWTGGDIKRLRVVLVTAYKRQKYDMRKQYELTKKMEGSNARA